MKVSLNSRFTLTNHYSQPIKNNNNFLLCIAFLQSLDLMQIYKSKQHLLAQNYII